MQWYSHSDLRPTWSRSLIDEVLFFWTRLGLQFGCALALLVAFGLTLGSYSASANAGRCSGGRAHLFDCRAYEMVSPAYKEGFSVAASLEGISEDGSRVLALSLGIFSNPEGTSGSGVSYEMARGETGWLATSLAMPFSSFSIYAVSSISPNLQSSLWAGSTPTQSNASQGYLKDLYFGPPDGPLGRVGPLYSPEGHESLVLIGASYDLRRSLFFLVSPNVGEESSLWPGDTTVDGRRPSLYEYEYTGEERPEPQLVGVSDMGVPGNAGTEHLISDCGTQLGSGGRSFGEGDTYNAVSADGSLVFFTSLACSGGPLVNEVYARVKEAPGVPAHTVAVSEPSKVDCSACLTNEGARKRALFLGASENGERAFFLTEQELLPGAEGKNLYEYDFSAPAAERVSRVSVPLAGEAGVLGVARVSEDGSHVYFVAEGVLTSANKEGKSPVLHEPNLYVFSSECAGGGSGCPSPMEHMSFVATLSRGDGADWAGIDKRPVQVTPNGNFCCFQSVADLTSDEEGREEAGQIFEYDAQKETLVRVSHGEGGYNEDGNSKVYPATLPVQNDELDMPIGHFTGLAMSSDGSRVFFSSPAALTPQALNGVVIGNDLEGRPIYAVNIYEYHDGAVGLISDGHDTLLTLGHPAVELLGTDESGLDVFFSTADGLVPQDTDTQVDIYDARVDGGFALPKTAPCLADSCQDGAATPPLLLAPASSSVVGEVVSPGQVQRAASPKKKTGGVRKRKAKAKKRVHKTRRAKHGSILTSGRKS